MRAPLRHAVAALRAAGFEIDQIRQAGRHTEVLLPRPQWWRSRPCAPREPCVPGVREKFTLDHSEAS